MENPNPVELAGQIGYDLYGEIGRSAFEELELSFASKIAPRFKRATKLRSYVNLNFYWARGYFKNTVMEEFEECLPSTFTRRKVTSATIETMFGSMNTAGTKIIPPLFWGYEMCFIPELLAFLGSGDIKDKVNVFNEVLEGKETTRDLLKFGNAEQGLIDEYKGGKNGLSFDGRTLRYVPSTCFVIGTRPVDNMTYTYLEQSGFWGRFHTLQFRITDVMARDFFTGSPLPKEEVDINSLKGQLRKFNEGLFEERDKISGDIPDYDTLLLPVLQKANEIGTKMCEHTNLDWANVLNKRISGDIIREVNAYKILRPRVSLEDVKKWAIPRLPHFFDFAINPIIAPSTTIVRQKTVDECLQAVLQLTKGQPKRREEIQEALQKQSYLRATIDRALELLRQKGLNKSQVYGIYETA